jgi:hypothetical protein
MIEIQENTSTNELVIGIVGIGKIGQALWSIFDGPYQTLPIDPQAGYDVPAQCKVDQLHITIPYNELFVEEVVTWVATTDPFHIIIHSTIVPGTMEALDNVLKVHDFDCMLSYSPCYCWAPHIKDQLMTMSKNLAGYTEDNTRAAAMSMEEAGMNVTVFSTPEALEWAHVFFVWRTALEQYWTNSVHEVSENKDLNFIEMAPAYTELMNSGLSQIRSLSRFFPIMTLNHELPVDKHSAETAALSLEVLENGPFKEVITGVMDSFRG